MTEVGPAETLEIEAALAALGVPVRSILVLSPLKKGARRACRVDTADGRTIKARQFDTAEAARQNRELRNGLDAAFSSALALQGCVLLEEWVEGRELAEKDYSSHAEEAGAVLGRLHAMPLPAVDAIRSTKARLRVAIADLEIIEAGGKLEAAVAGALRSELRRLDPGRTRGALIHNDFCAENLLIGVDGRLRVIDNEMIAVGEAGFDMGRTFERWSMTPAVWAQFCRGYGSAAPFDIEEFRFWQIVAALSGARFRLDYTPGRLGPVLELLHRLAAGVDGTEDV